MESGSAAGDIVLTLDVAFDVLRGTERLTFRSCPRRLKRAA